MDKRIYKYMLYYTEWAVGIVIIGSIVFPLYMWVLNGLGKESLMQIINDTHFYTLFFGIIVALMVGVTFIPLIMQLLIACGSTRKEVLKGIVFFSFFYPLQVTLIHIVLTLITRGGYNAGMNGYELTVFAVMSVAVMLFLLDGVLINKVGRVAYILSIIFISVLGGVVGFISANGFDSVVGIAAKTVIMICSISVIIYAIALLFLRAVLKKYEVKS